MCTDQLGFGRLTHAPTPMGHSRIGTLPRSRRWKEVIGLISTGASVGIVAAATAKAAEHTLEQKADDPVLHHAFYLLTQIPLAARSERRRRQLSPPRPPCRSRSVPDRDHDAP